MTKPETDDHDGLRVEASSTMNQIFTNHMDNNGFHDCHDDSNPPANTWTNDAGDTENRPGLCQLNVKN